MDLEGTVCLVTGARRGVGRGIALALSARGATVYITGRSLEARPDDPYPSLAKTAAEAAARGGKCLPVVCDHAEPAQIEALFDRIAAEQGGRLDLLVNNAHPGAEELRATLYQPYWTLPDGILDRIAQVTVLGAFRAATRAARLMVPRGRGLIVNVSAPVGLRSVYSCVNGIEKEAVDRMAEDCAQDLAPAGVACVSLWPDYVITESLVDFARPRAGEAATEPAALGRAILRRALETEAESPEFVGRCVVALLTDPRLMAKTGKILLTADLAREYGLRFDDGRWPIGSRQLNRVAFLLWPTWAGLLSFLPSFLKLPLRWLNFFGKRRYR